MTPSRAPFLSSGLALAVAALLGGCLFGTSSGSLNDDIENGKAAKALSTIEEQLVTTPQDPALNLLAVKARLALCAQRNCTEGTVSGTLPQLLQPLQRMLANVSAPVPLGKKQAPLTPAAVFTWAVPAYAAMPNQPAPVLTLYAAAPAAIQPAVAQALFAPALTLARSGQFRQAGQVLAGVAADSSLPPTYTSFAQVMNGLFTNNPPLAEPHVIALRSAAAAPALPASAAALVPWAVLAGAQNLSSATTPPAFTALTSLPGVIKAWQWNNLMSPAAQGLIGNELVAIAANPTALAQWQGGWGSNSSLPLSLKQMSLTLNPNQPGLWGTYLPELVSASLVSGSTGGVMPMVLPVATLTSETGHALGNQLIEAATRLSAQPANAVPLVTLAGQMPLSRPQQIGLEKLVQDLLVKVSTAGDVTSTLQLAQAQPGVALNNRQLVVPLLVKDIRDNLRNGDFDGATAKADLLTNTLKMDVELGPIILQEFADDLKRRKIAEQLAAAKPDMLLEAPDDIALDLGPLFDFMQEYFEKQPDVITLQLTTLIAQAQGAYGQATAMYRLGSHFPPSAMPEDKQQAWLAANLTAALINDKTISGPALATLAVRLAQRHPALNMPALAEEALKRTATLEDQRTLWAQAEPEFRATLKTIRPEFSALMRGVDDLEAKKYNAAAAELSPLAGSAWAAQAKPFLQQFQQKLIGIAGAYVPLSGATTGKTAAIIVAPAGLEGGALGMVSVTFINRVGTLTEDESANMRSNAAAVHRFTLALPLNFDTLSLAVTQQALAEVPHGGTFSATYGGLQRLVFQPSAEGNAGATLLQISGNTVAGSSQYVRSVVGAEDPLRPDGDYLMETRIGQPLSGTEAILPPGSLLNLATADTMAAPVAGDDTSAAWVYPLTGTLRHPAGTQAIPLTGFFDPLTLTSTFSFSYPLPHSGQPVKATARCQALAGPVVCGVHHLHSPRQAYATLIAGLQTRESLTTAAAARAEHNQSVAQTLGDTAAAALGKSAPLAASASPTLVITVSGTVSAVSAAAMAAAVPVAASATAPVAVTPTGVFIHEGVAMPASTPSPSFINPTVVSATTAAPHAEDDTDAPILPASIRDAPAPAAAPAPGVFIHHAASPTVPATPSPTTH